MTGTKRTSLFLMANLGAEVSRLISAKKRGDAVLIQTSLAKAGSIIRELEGLPDMRTRLKEVGILSKVVRAIVDPISGWYVDPEHIKSYFTPFAMRLMAIG